MLLDLSVSLLLLLLWFCLSPESRQSLGSSVSDHSRHTLSLQQVSNTLHTAPLEAEKTLFKWQWQLSLWFSSCFRNKTQWVTLWAELHMDNELIPKFHTYSDLRLTDLTAIQKVVQGLVEVEFAWTRHFSVTHDTDLRPSLVMVRTMSSLVPLFENLKSS